MGIGDWNYQCTMREAKARNKEMTTKRTEKMLKLNNREGNI